MVKDYDTHMWIVVQEEAGELIQAISKMLRFGPGQSCTGEGPTNEEQVLVEFNQLVAMMNMQIENGCIKRLSDEQVKQIQDEKVRKINHYYDLVI